MAGPALSGATDEQSASRERVVVVVRPSHGRLNRTVFYAPRFARHLRRRLDSGMGLTYAWHSTRRRMRDYR